MATNAGVDVVKQLRKKTKHHGRRIANDWIENNKIPTYTICVNTMTKCVIERKRFVWINDDYGHEKHEKT